MTKKISSSSFMMIVVQLTTIIAALLSTQPSIVVASSTSSSRQSDGSNNNHHQQHHDTSILFTRRTMQRRTTDDTQPSSSGSTKKHRLFQEGKLRSIKTSSSSEFDTGYRSNDIGQLGAAAVAVDKVSPAAALVERTHKETNRGANDSGSSNSSSSSSEDDDDEDDEDTIVNVNVNVNVHNNEQQQQEGDWFEDYKRIETTSSSSSSGDSSSNDGTSDDASSWILEGQEGHHGQNGGHKGPHYTIDPCIPPQQDGSWNSSRKLAKTHKSSKASEWNNDHYIMWMPSSGKSSKSTKGSKGIKCTYPPIVMPSKSPIEVTPNPTSPPFKDTPSPTIFQITLPPIVPIDTPAPILGLTLPPKDTTSPTMSGTPIPQSLSVSFSAVLVYVSNFSLFLLVGLFSRRKCF